MAATPTPTPRAADTTTMADTYAASTGLATPSPELIGPGHYATLGVHQGASRKIIMEAYDALESRVVKELTYDDEPTEEQKEDKAKRLQEIRTAARILNDPGTRRRYDRQLRGEGESKLDSYRDDFRYAATYRDHDRPASRSSRRSSTSSRPGAIRKNSNRRVDRYRSSIVYPDVWIAAVDGRDWSPPKRRLSSPYPPPSRPEVRSRSPKKELTPKQGRRSPVYNAYKDRR